MYDILTDPETGLRSAVDQETGHRVAILPDEGQTARMFNRRAFKQTTDGMKNVNWLVAELDGVRAYVDDGAVLLTRRDLYP